MSLLQLSDYFLLLLSWVTGVCFRARTAVPSGNDLGHTTWRKHEHFLDFEDCRVKDDVLKLSLWLLKQVAEH